MKLITKFWTGIAVLIVLSPLGLLLPQHFKSGSAWGEWGTGELQKLAGYVPEGLEKLSSLWHAPMPGYTFGGWEEKGPGHLSLSYIISAVAGILAVVCTVVFIGKHLTKRE